MTVGSFITKVHGAVGGDPDGWICITVRGICNCMHGPGGAVVFRDSDALLSASATSGWNINCAVRCDFYVTVNSAAIRCCVDRYRWPPGAAAIQTERTVCRCEVLRAIVHCVFVSGACETKREGPSTDRLMIDARSDPKALTCLIMRAVIICVFSGCCCGTKLQLGNECAPGFMIGKQDWISAGCAWKRVCK